MWKFLAGFSMGLYTGTYYECKPIIDKFINIIKENMPNEKN
jgi:hypothetical protein